MTEGSDILTLERRVAGDGDLFITLSPGPVRPMMANLSLFFLLVSEMDTD